ncbi:hypothetical protein Tco_0333933, partial [Tanacetum coccineum]
MVAPVTSPGTADGPRGTTQVVTRGVLIIMQNATWRYETGGSGIIELAVM